MKTHTEVTDEILTEWQEECRIQRAAPMMMVILGFDDDNKEQGSLLLPEKCPYQESDIIEVLYSVITQLKKQMVIKKTTPQ
jgi:hypothetical protein